MKAAQERVATPCDVVKSDFHGFGFKCKGMTDCSLPDAQRDGPIKSSGWCSPKFLRRVIRQCLARNEGRMRKAGHIWNEDKLKGGKTNCEATKHCIYIRLRRRIRSCKMRSQFAKDGDWFQRMQGRVPKASDAYKTIVGEGSNAVWIRARRGEIRRVDS